MSAKVEPFFFFSNLTRCWKLIDDLNFRYVRVPYFAVQRWEKIISTVFEFYSNRRYEMELLSGSSRTYFPVEFYNYSWLIRAWKRKKEKFEECVRSNVLIFAVHIVLIVPKIPVLINYFLYQRMYGIVIMICTYVLRRRTYLSQTTLDAAYVVELIRC